MSNDDGNILRAMDGSGAMYPPFDKVTPYPKFLCINLYGGYTLIGGKLICITDPDQMLLAQRLQSALDQIGISWEISLRQSNQGRENVGVQFEIKPLEYRTSAYEFEIENYSPEQDGYQSGIISLFATDLTSLENGINTLIQVIHLGFEKFGEEIASLWVQDWSDASPGIANTRN